MFVNPNLGAHQDTPAHVAVERARADTKGLAGIPTLRHTCNGYMWDKVEKYLQAAVSGLGLTLAAGTQAPGPPPGSNLPRKDRDDEINAHKQALAPSCELPGTQPLTHTGALAQWWRCQKQHRDP